MDFYSYYPWVNRPFIPYYKPNMEIAKYENRPIYPSPRIFPFLPGTYYRMELMPKARGWTTQSLNSRWVFNLKPEKRFEIKQIGPPPTGIWTRSPSDNFEFKPTVYPSPSGSINGVYGQRSQIISLGLKNLTKKDVTFTNKAEEIVYHMDDNRNKVQLISVKPTNSSLENVKKSIMYVHSVQKIEIKSPEDINPVKIQVPSVEEMKISSEHVFKSVKEEASCLTLMAPNPSLSTTYSQAESEDIPKQKSSMRFESNHSFEKLNKVLNSKHIDEVTVTILNMFTHHESEDGDNDNWNPDNIPLLGIDSDINIKYLLHLLSRNGQELSTTLTRRQKRDLAGMIDSQVTRFKLTGLTWATMCEKIISGIDGKVAILQKLIPCFASITKD